MKRFAFLLLLIPGIAVARPRNPNPTTPNQVWQNDLDLYDQTANLAITVSSISATAAYGSTGTIANSRLDHSSVTFQGNTFNGNNQLVQTNGGGGITISSITATTGGFTNLTTTNLAVTTETWKGFGIMPVMGINQLTTTTSSSTTNSTYTNTNIAESINTKFSTSLVMITISFEVAVGAGNTCNFTINRSGTNLFGAAGFFQAAANYNGHVSFSYLDSPAGAATYTLQFKTGAGGTTIETNNETAVMLLTEIAQ